EFLQVDGLTGILAGVDGDVSDLVDAKVALTPVADAIGFHRVLNLPLFHQFHQRMPFLERVKRGVVAAVGGANETLCAGISFALSCVEGYTSNVKDKTPGQPVISAEKGRSCGPA